MSRLPLFLLLALSCVTPAAAQNGAVFGMQQPVPPGHGMFGQETPGARPATPIPDSTPVCIRHPRTRAMICHTIAEWRELGVTRAELAALLQQTRDAGGLRTVK